MKAKRINRVRTHGKIVFRFGLLDGQEDLCVSYGHGVPRCDRSLVMSQMTQKVMRFDNLNGKPYFEDSFIEELEKRGYDISTLIFSVQKKVE